MASLTNPRGLGGRPLNRNLAEARAGGHASALYKDSGAMDRLMAFGAEVGNMPWEDYLKGTTQKHGGVVWPKLVLDADSSGASVGRYAVYYAAKRNISKARTLVVPVSFPADGIGHRNVWVGSLTTVPMQFFEFEPHGAQTQLTKHHERVRPLLQALVKAVGQLLGRPAILNAYTGACVAVGPQAINNRFMNRHVAVKRFGLCTMWSLLFAKKFLEAGSAGPAAAAVRRIQEDMGGGPAPVDEVRRQRGLKELLDMADGVMFYSRVNIKGKFAAGVARLTQQEKDVLLPGYVSPAERIAKALRASTKTPLPVYLIRLGSNPAPYDMRKLFVWFCAQPPVAAASTKSIPRYQFPPRYEQDEVDFEAFKKIVVTMMAKDLDLLPFQTGCLQQEIGTADFTFLVTAHNALMRAWYVRTKKGVDVQHGFRTADATAAACVLGFKACCGASITAEEPEFDAELLRRALGQLQAVLTTAGRRCLALLWFACCYGESAGAAWPRATLLTFLGCTGGAGWSQLIPPDVAEPHRLALVETAKLELGKFLQKRQYSTAWRFVAAHAAGVTACVALGSLVPGGMIVSAAVGGAIPGPWSYYRLTNQDVSWLTNLQRQLAGSLVDLMFVVDAGGVVTRLEAGMRLKEVMLRDNVETASVWRRTYKSLAVRNSDFH